MMTYEKLMTHFPGTPRPQQELALQEIAPWLDRLTQPGSQLSFFGCDAPTGVGKSRIAIAVARAFNEATRKQVWIVTQNKLLQEQYMDEFKEDLVCLKGLSNYACYSDPGKSCDESRCGRLIKEGKSFPEACTRKCEYDHATRAAQIAPIVMLNAAKALNVLKVILYAPATAWNMPGLIIYDEGHSIEPQLDNESSLIIKPEELEKLQLNFKTYFGDPMVGWVPNLESKLSDLYKHVSYIYQTEEAAPESFRDLKRLKKSDSLSKKISETLNNIEEFEIEYVNASTEMMDLRPLKIYPIFRKLVQAPVLFLSATLLSKEGFCTTIGLDQSEMGWVSVDSPFPVENRKIHNGFGMGAQGINFQNQVEQTPNVLARIRDILDRYPNDRGIIHCHTYRWAQEIMKMNASIGGRFLYPRTAMEQKEILDIHARSKNTVLLSPSMTEGVDLKGDLARFGMLVKVPYLPTQDPVIKARMDADQTWYGYRTIMTVIQACGRIVRSMEDHGDTYLLDPGFVKFITRYQKLFPPWFLAAYQKGKYLGRV